LGLNTEARRGRKLRIGDIYSQIAALEVSAKLVVSDVGWHIPVAVEMGLFTVISIASTWCISSSVNIGDKLFEHSETRQMPASDHYTSYDIISSL
jgi:hypothetical protein